MKLLKLENKHLDNFKKLHSQNTINSYYYIIYTTFDDLKWPIDYISEMKSFFLIIAQLKKKK